MAQIPVSLPITVHWVDCTRSQSQQWTSPLCPSLCSLLEALLVHVSTSQLSSPPPELQNIRSTKGALFSEYRSYTHKFPSSPWPWPSLMVTASFREDWEILDSGVGENIPSRAFSLTERKWVWWRFSSLHRVTPTIRQRWGHETSKDSENLVVGVL